MVNLLGYTREGNTISVRVLGVDPYFYIECEKERPPDPIHFSVVCTKLLIDWKTKNENSKNYETIKIINRLNSLEDYILDVNVVSRKSVNTYHKETSLFIR